MSEAPREAGPGGVPPRMRAGTTDRQAAVDRLTTHFSEGRLDAAEFDQRVATAYGSTYLDELTPLFADLPQSRPDRPPWASGPYGRRPPGVPGPGGDRSEWAGWGGPGPGGRRAGPPPPVRLAVFVLMLFLIIGSISAVGHGFFPVPLLWLAMVLLMVSRTRRHRWSGHR